MNPLEEHIRDTNTQQKLTNPQPLRVIPLHEALLIVLFGIGAAITAVGVAHHMGYL